MRLVLRERGADHAWITTGDSASGSGAIRPRPQRLADRVETGVCVNWEGKPEGGVQEGY